MDDVAVIDDSGRPAVVAVAAAGLQVKVTCAERISG